MEGEGGREDWEGVECCSSPPCDTLREGGGGEEERERGWEIHVYCI